MSSSAVLRLSDNTVISGGRAGGEQLQNILLITIHWDGDRQSVMSPSLLPDFVPSLECTLYNLSYNSFRKYNSLSDLLHICSFDWYTQKMFVIGE